MADLSEYIKEEEIEDLPKLKDAISSMRVRSCPSHLTGPDVYT